jgi:hypothetical protein
MRKLFRFLGLALVFGVMAFFPAHAIDKSGLKQENISMRKAGGDPNMRKAGGDPNSSGKPFVSSKKCKKC